MRISGMEASKEGMLTLSFALMAMTMFWLSRIYLYDFPEDFMPFEFWYQNKVIFYQWELKGFSPWRACESSAAVLYQSKGGEDADSNFEITAMSTEELESYIDYRYEAGPAGWVGRLEIEYSKRVSEDDLTMTEDEPDMREAHEMGVDFESG